MDDAKSLSAMIRKKKKGSLRPDMDSAGQEGVDPVVALDTEKASQVNDAMMEPDHEPASPSEMGEGESSQSIKSLKRAMRVISQYLDSMHIED